MNKMLVTMIFGFSLVLVQGGCSDDDKDEGKKDSGTLKLDTTVADDTGGGQDDTGGKDLAKPEGTTTPVEHNVGEGCTNATKAKDCKKGSPVCMNWSALFSSASTGSMCTKECLIDDPKTPLVNEDNCPTPGYKCVEFKLTNNTSAKYCLKKCTPSATKNPCPASSGQTCSPMSNRWAGFKEAVCIYPACKDNKDCPVWSDTTCSTDTDCKALTGGFCRSGKCAQPGNCTKGGLCGKHTLGKAGASVGDPCTKDTDCPGNGVCQLPTKQSYGIGESWVNGYCIVPSCMFSTQLPDFACPTGSSCFEAYIGGVCFKNCTTASAKSCRGNAKDNGGDYECYDLTSVAYSGGAKGPSKPICLEAATSTCDRFSATTDCTLLAAKANLQKMGCRDRYTGVVLKNKKDPKGVCLDDTASGPFKKPATDAGSTPADSGSTTPADAGVKAE